MNLPRPLGPTWSGVCFRASSTSVRAPGPPDAAPPTRARPASPLQSRATQASPLPRERQDAIHRALLAGLLGNVGMKLSPHEYQGVGKKFTIFPGSAVFKRGPEWVMAAELVETTRLYARTVGPARADWIERLAEHLVKRTYADEHWHREHARVEAFERVTLQGLVLVPRRPVHYGPIEPGLSRQIFILHA